jgi:ribosomal small subunit protein bTHX
MGKGDKKTRRGKINIGSSGVRRSRKKKGYKPGIQQKAPPVPKEIPEVTPVVIVPETPPVLEQVEEKAPKKAADKKAAPKKSSVKGVEGEPKQAKTRKKPAKPTEDLFTEKKEDSE